MPLRASSEVDSSGSSSGSECSASEAEAEAARKARATFAQPADWMVIFGASLAACAGVVNAAALLELHTVVSHVTGLTTTLGLRLEGVRIGAFSPRGADGHVGSALTSDSLEGHASVAGEALLLISCFVFGAFLCGLVIPKNALHFGGKSFYGVALLGAAALNACCGLGSLLGWRLPAACSAACASGLQNAMCTMHLGAIVRTTHVTGTATDIGSTSGRAAMIMLRAGCARRRLTYSQSVELEVDTTKLRILVAIYSCFAAGCYLGALAHSHMGAWTFFVPASALGLGGILYTCFREALKRRIREAQVRRLRAELEGVSDVLQIAKNSRTRANSRASSCQAHMGDDADEDMEVKIEQAVLVLQDLQETIQDVYDDEQDDAGKRATLAPSSSAARRARSRSHIDSCCE